MGNQVTSCDIGLLMEASQILVSSFHLFHSTSLIKSYSKNITSKWFLASEATGDFMGIRYGRVPQGCDEIEWIYVSHCDCDGIGGLARLLRERGAEILKLPQTSSPCRGGIGPLWRLWRGSREDSECADRRDWKGSGSAEAGASEAVAWHLYSEEETNDIRERCRREQVTVNSFLLQRLDQAVRPEIRRPEVKIPWMIPVNLRGDINHADDTENHVSCVEVRVGARDSAREIQREIRRRLERGDHRANHLLLGLGSLLGHGAKVKFLAKDRSKSAGNIGAFSNLGVWDSEKKMETNDSWLFCPPVAGGQLLGAGCVTFRNRLGLAIQGHAGFSASPEIAAGWMRRWVGEGRDGLMIGDF
jgi:hypothetical protein